MFNPFKLASREIILDNSEVVAFTWNFKLMDGSPSCVLSWACPSNEGLIDRLLSGAGTTWISSYSIHSGSEQRNEGSCPGPHLRPRLRRVCGGLVSPGHGSWCKWPADWVPKGHVRGRPWCALKFTRTMLLLCHKLCLAHFAAELSTVRFRPITTLWTSFLTSLHPETLWILYQELCCISNGDR